MAAQPLGGSKYRAVGMSVPWSSVSNFKQVSERTVSSYLVTCLLMMKVHYVLLKIRIVSEVLLEKNIAVSK